MHTRPRVITLLMLLVAACTGDSDNPVKRALAEQPRAGPPGAAVAFRFLEGGADRVTLFRLPGLDQVAWRFEAGAAAVAQPIGFAGDEDLVYWLTTDKRLVALDLTSGRARTADSLVALATLGPAGTPIVIRTDGSVARIERRSRVPVPDSFATIPSAIWGGTRNRLVAVVPDRNGRHLVLVAPGQPRARQPLPEGHVAVAMWGDVAAVATDSGLMLLDPGAEVAPRFRRVQGGARLAVFSPSGHRLYVVTGRDELLSVERFELDVADRLSLPGRADALRPDPLGRWLLLRPTQGDSVWIVDVARWSLAATLPGSWDESLPAVAPDGTLLLRRDRRVIAFDPATLSAVAETRDRRGNRWLVAAWDPRRPALELADDSVRAPEPPGQLIYIQVSSTSNQAWAQDLTENLRRAGMKATVLPPDAPTEPYRVVLGPYATREAAEEIRSRLQMPSWILTRDTTRTVP